MTEQSLFKWRHFESEIILLCVRWYLRYAVALSRSGGNDARTGSVRIRKKACHGDRLRGILIRTTTHLNFLEYPTDVVLLVVLWRLRYKLSLRDLAEMFLERGLVFTHETVREWEACFAPFIAEQLRARRHGHAGTSWHIDETYRHTCMANGVIFTEP
jgi:transposase-like protein